MPKVRPGLDPREERFRDDLLDFSNGARYLNASMVGRYLGIRNQASINRWLEGVPFLQRGERKTYHVNDLAERLRELEVR